jgi:NDP-sugar pyrophosphorylase family protein
MKKEKIAISIDKGILDAVDSTVDGMLIRSRSQAIEAVLARGLKSTIVDAAVILLHPCHIQTALKKIDGISLIKKQIAFFRKNLARKIIITTGISPDVSMLISELGGEDSIEVVQKDSRGNAEALLFLKESLPENFIVLSGDVFIDFNILSMAKEHLEKGKTATMALMTKQQTAQYGNAVLDGNQVVEFSEKPKKSESHVVNAGIYLFSRDVFNFFSEKTKSLEKDLFPELARLRRLYGYFTKGTYIHLG